jgi:non-ribosomal peptide synthetase component E (peptide arylation enzyme)
LSGHPSIAQVAIVGIPDRVLGEIGVAFVVAAEDATPDLDELRAHVRGTLADYKAPDRLFVLEVLPLTAMAKIDKHALADLASDA